jgi:hypothetical protein
MCAGGAWDVAPEEPSTRCPECGQLVPDVTTLIGRITVPPDVIELLPASVLRADNVLPCEADQASGALTVATDFSDRATIEKLRFISNRAVHVVFAERRAIASALDRHLGTE